MFGRWARWISFASRFSPGFSFSMDSFGALRAIDAVVTSGIASVVVGATAGIGTSCNGIDGADGSSSVDGIGIVSNVDLSAAPMVRMRRLLNRGHANGAAEHLQRPGQ